MAIKIIPVVREVIHLAENDDEFKELEGECPDSERAWVSVRQATEQDEADVQDLQSRTIFRFATAVHRAEEVREVNWRRVRAMQAYKCLCGAGNITDADGKELLTFKPTGKGYDRFDGDYSAFQNVWGQLPAVVTTAILTAVYTLNPGWGWYTRGEG